MAPRTKCWMNQEKDQSLDLDSTHKKAGWVPVVLARDRQGQGILKTNLFGKPQGSVREPVSKRESR